jgi:hypothetical protein
MASNKKAEKAPEMTKFKKYETITIHRQELKKAPYNPRSISDKAKKNLRKNFQKVGFLGGIVWNKRTGNIISGHQRIAALDACEASYDYMIEVSVVDLDEKTEKEQNVFMNNTSAQGDFDVEGLEVLMKDDSLDLDGMGFDLADKFQLFGSNEMNHSELATLSNKLHEARELFGKLQKSASNRDQTHFYLVVVFKDDESRTEFTNRLGLPDNRYVDGKNLMELLIAPGV